MAIELDFLPSVTGTPTAVGVLANWRLSRQYGRHYQGVPTDLKNSHRQKGG